MTERTKEEKKAWQEECHLQRRGDALVNIHIVQCVSVLVGELCKIVNEDNPWYDDIVEVTSPMIWNCGCNMDEEEKKEATDNGEEFEPCGDCYNEIYEHWVVSDWFGERLTEEGHSVRDVMGLTIWGRPTSGQGIAIDGVVRDIIQKHEMFEHIE